jgi:hypothetical protein
MFVVIGHRRRELSELRKSKPIASSCYRMLLRLHRQSVSMAATLGTRLTPHSKLDKSQPTDGALPVG